MLFELAERLGMTVAQLLTGEAQPLTAQEMTDWIAFFRVRRSKEEKANRGAQAKQRIKRGRRRK